MDHQLIDDGLWPERYVTGRLDPADRTRFEAHFVDCPKCLDNIEAAEALALGLKAKSATPAPVAVLPSRPARASRSKWAIGLALAAGFLGVLWAVKARQGAAEELASQQRANAEALAEAKAELVRERTARQQAEARLEAQRQPLIRVPVLALLATRGADGPTLELPPTGQPIVLTTEREDPPHFSVYFVDIRSEAGKEVWQGRVVPSSREAVVFALDSSYFGLERYVLSLEGEGPGGRKVLVGKYSFRTVAASKN